MTTNAESSALHQKLKNLTPTLFEEVIFTYGEAGAYMPTSHNSSQVDKSLALVRYAASTHRLQQLQQIIDALAPPDRQQNSLLPYLVDRNPQVETFKIAFDAYLQAYAKSALPPFVCLLYGNDDEYGELLWRLEHQVLQRHKDRRLKTLGERLPVPLAGDINSVEVLSIRLATSFDEIEISQRAQYRAVCVEVNLYDFDMLHGQHNLLEAFLSFCCEWQQEQVLRHPCVIFLCLRMGQQQARSVWQQLRAWSIARQKSKMDTWFIQQGCYTHAKFQQQFQLSGVMLPKLESIPLRDARMWLDMQEIRQEIKTRRLSYEKLRKQIGLMYQHTDKHTMSDLCLELEQLLHNPEMKHT